MKLLLVLYSLLLAHVNPPLLVVDRNLKKPLGYTATFSTQQYLQQTFPVYKADVDGVLNAVDQAVKAVEKNAEMETHDTISAGHTTLLIRKNVAGTADIEVVLLTNVDEIHTSFSFALVRLEPDVRKVQRRLLDFATYLAP